VTDAVDLDAAARRIEERRGWLDAEIARAERKLANAGFTTKAPAAVVQSERDKLARLCEERDGL
jgi:valyl-tRNA synthetase